MIKIIKWNKNPTARRLGTLLISYHKLLLPCELVLYSKKNYEKLWIRMPEICFNRSQRLQFTFWIDEADSQNFQMEVLRMMQTEHGIDLAVAKEIHAEYVDRRKAERKITNNDFKT